MDMKSRNRLVVLLVWLLMVGFCIQTVLAEQTTDNRQYVSIDFNDVDISVFIKFISELTGTNFVVDRRVKGKVTIISPSKISVDEAYKVFESVLEVNGFSTVQSGEVTKIVPAPEARSKNVKTLLESQAGEADDRIVTQLIPLKYADPNLIKRLFAPLVSKGSVILSYDPTNMLIITDVHSNIKRLMRILKQIDVQGIGQELSVIPLQYADAQKTVRLLQTMFRQRRVKGKPPEEPVRVMSDERTNTLVILASEDDTIKIKELIARLDREMPKGTEKIRVYYLEHATAEELAEVLQSLSSGTRRTTKSKKGKKAVAPIVSQDVNITADKATNSLIIMAEKDDYQVLEDVIEKLDIPRAMVYIECLIMEVNVDKDFKLGTEWIAMGEASYEGTAGGYGGGFSGSDPGYGNISGLFTGGGETAAAVGTLPAGASLGLFSEAIKIGNIYFPNLAALIRTYRKDKNVHILSTPQILTTDNEEASITVGKNVPYQTRSAADNATDTYSSYEYKDVGIQLKITPQISKDRQIRLQIAQEVTKLDELATTASDRPTTLKRTIETTVVVEDKNVVVIGGLIDDSFSTTENKVPCLGDIPGAGWLFKSLSNSREKTNLFVFLTPHVVKGAAEAKALYQKKRDQIDKIDQEQTDQTLGIKMYKREFQDSELIPREPELIEEGESLRPETLTQEPLEAPEILPQLPESAEPSE